MNARRCFLLLAALLFAATARAGQPDAKGPQWVVYEGKNGLGKGKHVVLVSGDEEYRSEEGLPQLGKILARHHGFKCTVLFAIDPKTGEISPNVNNNIPGLEALKTADLMIIATRFRNLPDVQMKYVVDYVEAGKPIIGLRTATHAFNLDRKSKYAKYTWNNGSNDYRGGFGRQLLGETWVAHHGGHGSESTRGIIAPGQSDNPIVRGIKDGDVWGPTDVYTARPPADSTIVVLGQVLKGMKPNSEPVAGKKNEPMMPVAWTRTLKQTRVFTTTMGSSTDLESAGTRRLIVNAAYWALGMDQQIPQGGTDVRLVGEYRPTPFGFNRYRKGVHPADLQK